MRIENLPTDTELLDALQKSLFIVGGKKRPAPFNLSVSINSYPGLTGSDYKVGNASREASLRIALRVYLQRRGLLPPDKVV
jgi:hypothetical protein